MADSQSAVQAPLGLSLASPAPTLGLAGIIAGLLEADRYMVAGQFTYSVPGKDAVWTSYGAVREPATFEPLDTGQTTAFVAAIAAWDRLIAPNFTRVDDMAGPGYVRVGFSDYKALDKIWGYAYSPGEFGRATSARFGDIWIDAEYADQGFEFGSYDYHALLHEIGHVLGLKHPFEEPSLPAAYDSGYYTLMSYEADFELVVDFVPTSSGLQATYTEQMARTPMVLDIAAVQAVYGADPTTALGSTTYVYRQDTPIRESIYDAGGIDTLDASAFTRRSDIDLTPGAYSSLGYASVEERIADDTARFGGAAAYIRKAYATNKSWSVYTGRDNLGIAFSTTIENAIGGAGDDSITGNAAANGLSGNAGRDFIRGMDGDDQIDGGSGDDDLNGNQGSDLVRGGDGADTVRGGQGNDTLYGDTGDDPHLNGNNGADIVFGGVGRDTLYGGQDADTLYGEDGDDWLSGDLGDDVLVGGPGADRYLFRAGSGNDWAADFDSASGDRVQLPPGAAYSLATVSGQVVIVLAAGGQLGLAGVGMAQLGSDWLVFA